MSKGMPPGYWINQQRDSHAQSAEFLKQKIKNELLAAVTELTESRNNVGITQRIEVTAKIATDKINNAINILKEV